MKLNSVILERYIKIALNNISDVYYTRNHYNFRCNICGDGKKKKSKRGHIRYSDTDGFFYFKCYNEGCLAAGEGNAWSAEKWLKKTNTSLHSQYVREILAPKDKEKIKNKLDSIKIQRREPPKKTENFGKIVCIKENSDNILVQKAITYCKERLIPDSVWKYWFVSLEGKYKNRLIIPFYDKEKKIYYFQGRTLTGQEPKYLNREKGKENAIYNYYYIDKKKPVHVFEGPIDSLFIENSVAVLGVSFPDEVKEKLDELETRWIYDNDETGRVQAEKVLRKGQYIFLWKEFLKDKLLPDNVKDINEVVVKSKKPIGDIKKYFSNSYYDLIKL